MYYSKLFPQRLSCLFLNTFYIIFILLVMCGCNQAPQKVFKIGTNVWPGNEPFYLARAMNYLDSKQVHFVELTSASEVIRAFRNGTIDGASVTLDEMLLLTEQGVDARVILVLDISAGGDVIMGQPEIKTMAEAKGKRVGLENTALGSYVLYRALEISGLSKDDVVLIPREVNEHEKSFLDGEIDLVVTFEPVKSKLLAKGANILFDSRQIPNEIVDVFIVRPQSVKKDQEILIHIVKGWYKALSYLDKEPRKAAEIMKDRLGISPDEVISAFDGLVLPGKKSTYDLLSKETSTSLLKSSRNLADVMYKNKLLQKEIDTSMLFDNSIISTVQ